MPTTTIFQPKYENSWALVIGINDYRATSPLEYARHDAEVLAQSLIETFQFPEQNVRVLLDEQASRDRIMSTFLGFTADRFLPDDRLLVFFAGHGHTKTGRRGDVGYLVPVDGDPGDLSTLIRWDDLTRNADLIRAKHILFLMDACYGGLALSRAVPPGSSRFLKDMLQRYSRQVLTAGKADELVADSGGPRAGHSIFTGHLLDSLGGTTTTTDGTISANAVMAYVYDRVAKDPNSRQSPHYGFIDGDGDFIFAAPNLIQLESDTEVDKVDKDVLIQVPASAAPLIPDDAET